MLRSVFRLRGHTQHGSSGHTSVRHLWELSPSAPSMAAGCPQDTPSLLHHRPTVTRKEPLTSPKDFVSVLQTCPCAWAWSDTSQNACFPNGAGWIVVYPSRYVCLPTRRPRPVFPLDCRVQSHISPSILHLHQSHISPSWGWWSAVEAGNEEGTLFILVGHGTGQRASKTGPDSSGG